MIDQLSIFSKRPSIRPLDYHVMLIHIYHPTPQHVILYHEDWYKKTNAHTMRSELESLLRTEGLKSQPILFDTYQPYQTYTNPSKKGKAFGWFSWNGERFADRGFTFTYDKRTENRIIKQINKALQDYTANLAP